MRTTYASDDEEVDFVNERTVNEGDANPIEEVELEHNLPSSVVANDGAGNEENVNEEDGSPENHADDERNFSSSDDDDSDFVMHS